MMSENWDFSSKFCDLPKTSELYPFKYLHISCCRLLRESKNPIKMQMITTQYKLRMNLFTTKSKKPMTGQNIHTNRRRNTRRFSSLFLDNFLGFCKNFKVYKDFVWYPNLAANNLLY